MRIRTEPIPGMVGATLREVAVLLGVFGSLDPMLGGRMTLGTGLAVGGFSLAVLVAGMLLELVERER